MLMCCRIAALLFLVSSALAEPIGWEQQIITGNELMRLGRYPEAERMYLAALREAETFPSGLDSRLATTLNNLGLLYFNQTRYREAEAL